MDTVRPARRRWLLSAGLLGLPLSGLGHAIAYVCRYGPRGLSLQGQGVHAYFPDTFALCAAALGAVLVAGLVVGGIGHVALGRGAGRRPMPRRRALDLILVVAAVQLQVYVVQETVEALRSGVQLDVPWLLAMLGWGLAGQLPVAALAGLGLSWLSARFEPALARLRSLCRACRPAATVPVPVAVPVRPAPDAAARLAGVAPAALVKRGPPPRCWLAI